MKIACLLHIDPKPPASISQWAESRGYELLSFNFILEQPKYPLDELGLIIVLGGPFFTSDPKIALQLAEEKTYLKEAILLDKPVIGICFGMQLLGEILGAATVGSPVKEIGLSPIWLNNDAKMDPIVSLLPYSFEVFHFHTQMSGLPKDSIVLAESAGCPRQIVRFARLVYGLQCHLEADFELIKSMVTGLPERAALLENISSFDFSNTHQLLHLFLDSLIKRSF
jgi:GMP synthase (glutamine-hydrolysing)